MKESSLFNDRYRRPAVIAAGLAMVLGGTACGVSKKAREISPAPCVSPFGRTDIYPGDHEHNIVADDPSTWVEGVEVDTKIPDEATALRVGATDPGKHWHVSQWIDKGAAHKIIMRIGPSDVRFETQLRYPHTYDNCHEKPDSDFEEKPVDQIHDAVSPGGWHRLRHAHPAAH